jgi:hypothetical protein
MNTDLIIASSAPGESPPPPSRNNLGTISDIRHDIVRTGTTISEVHRDVSNTHTMVSKLLKSQEETNGQNRSVGAICALFIAE